MYSVFVRLLMAMLLGSFMGADRSRKGSPAGLKTHSLVCIGSTLVMLTSEYCAVHFNIGDVTRMPAQVISGIGFLGAGTILVTGKDQIRGLTSAAGIWFSACVGLTVGIGFYYGAIIATFLEIIVFKILSKTSFQHSNRLIMELYMEYDEEFNFSKVMKKIKSLGIEILQVDGKKYQVFRGRDDFYNAVITMELPGEEEADAVCRYLEDAKGVIVIQDIT